MNFLDKAIAVISPRTALKRVRSRAVLDVMDKHFSSRKFEAAARGRRANGWPIYDGSANSETYGVLPTLRARARHMVQNNAYAQKAIKAITNNTVGAGIIPQPVSVSGSNKAKLKKIKAKWKQWADKKHCDFAGQHTFYGLQKLVMRTVAESGECLVLKRRTGKYKLQLQVIEPDFLDSSRDTRGATGDYVTQGVAFNKDGQRTGYWIYDRHPGEYGAYESKFRPASDVIHVYEILRPGQVRGVPFGISSLLRLKDYDDYEDAEIVRQKIAACFAAFVQDSDPSSSLGTGSSNDEDLLEKLEPGVIEYLPPGKTVTFANPPTTSNYDGFSRKILQGIAAGYGITYECLTGDLSNVNFSSGRMGWLEMARQLTDWQYNMMIPLLCDDVWSWFMDHATVTEGIKSDDIDVSWTPPRREMIDPKKETEALILLCRAGFQSWSETVRGMGYDPEAVMAEIQKDNALMDQFGFSFDSDGRKELVLKATAPAKEDTGKSS